MTLKQSSAVHIQALVSADGILLSSSSKLQLLVINLASVPGRQLINSPTAQSPERCTQPIATFTIDKPFFLIYMDVRLKKLKIHFPNGWTDISSENPDGPPTFIGSRLNEPGVLQISIAEYISGQKPNPNHDDLIDLSEGIGVRNNFGKLIKKESGNCNFGKYGTVEFAGTDFPYISVSHLSNGKDFVFSTFICARYPDKSEIDDVKGILTSMKRRRFLF